MIENLTTRSYFNYIAVFAGMLLFGLWAILQFPLVALVIPLFPLCLYIAIKYPIILCTGFVVFSYMRLHEVFLFLYPMHLPKLFGLGVLITLFLHLLTGKIRLFWNKELTLTTLFVLFVVLGVPAAINQPLALSGAIEFAQIYVMVLALAWLIRGTSDFNFIIKAVVTVGILVAAVALYNSHYEIDIVEGYRVTIGRSVDSLLSDPNDLALLLLLLPCSFAFALFFSKGTGLFSKLLGGVAIATIIPAILVTHSRGGLLGLAAIMTITIYQRIKYKSIFLICTFASLFVLYIQSGISDRPVWGADGSMDESAYLRQVAWEKAFNMALDNPLTGVGIHNYSDNAYNYPPFEFSLSSGVHSVWFQVLSEIGFVGFFIFIALVIMNLIKSKTIMKNAEMSVASGERDMVYINLIVTII